MWWIAGARQLYEDISFCNSLVKCLGCVIRQGKPRWCWYLLMLFDTRPRRIPWGTWKAEQKMINSNSFDLQLSWCKMQSDVLIVPSHDATTSTCNFYGRRNNFGFADFNANNKFKRISNSLRVFCCQLLERKCNEDFHTSSSDLNNFQSKTASGYKAFSWP